MRAGVNRVATVAMVTGVLLGTSVLGYGVARASAGEGLHLAKLVGSARHVPTATAAAPTGTPAPTVPRTERNYEQVSAPLPVARPRTTPVAGKRLLGPGDTGPKVRALQARLRQIAWFAGNVTDRYGPTTTAAVRGFQGKRKIAVTGYVDQRTLNRLTAMTHAPTADELANRLAGGTSTRARLDDRCRTGRVLCIDKSSRTVRWVVQGKVVRTMAVRFGASYTPTREGLFHVGWKSRDHVSKLYDSSMPFAMFFSGGQAVHYSSDFAARGYSGASHGCVNVRDYAGIKWLFDQVAVGDKVVVYWS